LGLHPQLLHRPVFELADAFFADAEQARHLAQGAAAHRARLYSLLS
jgi:hypothetical protein